MTDYNKLTVVKLKEILKERDLPTSGLKAALVARLVEDDAKPVDEAQEPEASPTPENDATAESTVEPLTKVSKPAEEPPADTQYETPYPTSTTEEIPAAPSNRAISAEKEVITQDGADDAPQKESHPPEDEQTARLPEQSSRADSPEAQAVPGTEPMELEVEPPAENGILQTTGPSAPEVLVSRSQPLPSREQPGSTPEVMLRERSTQASVDRDELMEDSRKRKRRSQSPPPSTLDTAIKKAKAIDGSPRIVMQEESQTQHMRTQETAISDKGDTMELETQEMPKEADLIGTQTQATQELQGTPKDDDLVDREAQESGVETAPEITSKEPPAEEAARQQSHPPSRPSPTSTKFKGLFETPHSTGIQKGDQDADVTIDERDVAPAMHPATSALYIRNFMRPLHPGNLRDYLHGIAKSHSESEDGEAIIEFYLDPIKTHCLVQFSSISAASRVRMAMHDRVWPDERSRKALWVDFVPEGKIKKWIEVEQEAGSGRGAPQKRWEVVYEREDDGIMAYLQEADLLGGRGPGYRGTGADGNRNGHQTQAPVRPEPPVPRGDPGKGSKALDDLFKFTTSKPKLYYQPVAQDMANQRLDRLAEGRGGGRSDEMRRFTFEEDTIVDKGPEYGANYRGGGRGGRGGYPRGGYSSRGGYRGDSWREDR